MIMGGIADRLEHLARQRSLRDLSRSVPGIFARRPRQRAIAGKSELTTGRSFLPLKHDAAHRLGKSGMPNPVQHHLRYRAFAHRVVARLVKLRGRQAVRGPRQVAFRSSEYKWPRCRVGEPGERHGPVERPRLITIQGVKLHRLHNGRRCGRPLH